MKPEVTYPDAERLMVDHLQPLLESDATVSVGVPAGWRPTSTPHVEVALDGTPIDLHPLAQKATVRLVARAGSTTAAKELAQLAHGLALAGGWPAGLTNVRPLTGLLADRDPKTDAELAAVTVSATVRSTPISGS